MSTLNNCGYREVYLDRKDNLLQFSNESSFSFKSVVNHQKLFSQQGLAKLTEDLHKLPLPGGEENN